MSFMFRPPLAEVLFRSTASVDNSVDESLIVLKMVDAERPSSSLPKKWALWPVRCNPHILWFDGSIFSPSITLWSHGASLLIFYLKPRCQ